MKLGVNIDHVATLREARKEGVPDPVEAARTAEEAGCDGITCHLREDRRHIQDDDLIRLKKSVETRLNLEMALSDEIIGIACRVKPNQVTLVPEKRNEVTTEGGLDVIKAGDKLTDAVKTFKEHGIAVSLFIDPDEEQILASARSGAEYIEIHTGSYARAYKAGKYQNELAIIRGCVELARGKGLIVNAGHGLDYQNIKEIALIKDIFEANIGHSIITRALYVGLGRAVKEMLDMIRNPS